MNIDLFVNLQAPNLATALVRSATSTVPVRMNDLVLADTVTLNIFLVSDGGYDDISGDATYSLRVGVGLPGQSPIPALQATWTPISTPDGWTGTVALNTTGIDDLLGDNASVPAYLEIELTDPSGKRHTIAQAPLTLRNEVVAEDSLTPTEIDTAYTTEAADAAFVQNRSAVTGLTGGGAGMLDEIVSVDLPVGILAAVTIDTATSFYQLTAGTDAESSPDVIRPDDYDGTTNAKVWKLSSTAIHAGNGLVKVGNTLHFAQSASYHAGYFFYSPAAGTTAAELSAVRWNSGAAQFEVHNGGFGAQVTITAAGVVTAAGTVSGATPTAAGHLTRKDYVDAADATNAAAASAAQSDATDALADAATAQATADGAQADATTAISDAGAAQATADAALPQAGGTMTGALVGTTATFNQVVLTTTAITYAGTTNVDMDAPTFRTLALTGDVTFTTSNKAAGKTVTLKILADSSTRNFTFPAWIFVGAAAPASIAASKTAILTITAFGTADTDIVAAYAVEA